MLCTAIPSLGFANQEDLEQSAAARALFSEGLAFADAQRWVDAADRFERARTLRPSAEISYNLSTSLMRLSKVVRAAELLRQVIADDEAPAAVKDAARARLAEVIPRVAYLTVDVPAVDARASAASASNARDPAPLVVLVDGRPFEDARLGVALPMDPTAHTVNLRRGTVVLERREILLDEGERRVLRFDEATLPSASSLRGGADGTYIAKAYQSHGAPAASQQRGWVWWVVGAAMLGLTATTVATTM